jgi:ABC-type lipoprotein export system ATPase subunit
MSHSPKGSIWNRWDLHFHTPASFDYRDTSISNAKIVECLVKEGIRVVAVTDHHTMDLDRIRDLQTKGAGQLTVLPGIELRDDHGGSPIHYICIFSEECDLDHVWTTMQGSLKLTAAGIAEKGGDEKVYVPIEDGAACARELGGVVSIHAGSKSNSIEGISNREQFQQRIKYDITSKYVDLMEIGQIKDIDVHLNMIFPATGLDKPLLLCSDNHKVTDYAAKAPLWFRADPTFRGLRMVIREPRDRVFIGDRPEGLVRVEQNKTKYVRGITFERKGDAPAGAQWFNGSIRFNPGLVAIVGNKGTGKSALADMLGLLGATKNAESFSFLSRDRFRHPNNGLAKFFDVSLDWESGETITKGLGDHIKPEEVERVKYLPQDHVERVCNELAGSGDEGFERELKSVIFSHVHDSQRLGQTTLDGLVTFQTGEKQARIDSLLKQLREVSRNRRDLEASADPVAKLEVEEKIARRELELKVHDEGKPLVVSNPAESGQTSPEDVALLNELSQADQFAVALTSQIEECAATLAANERRKAVAKRLVEKLANFQKDFDVFKTSLWSDANELGVTPDELVTVAIREEPVKAIEDAAVAAIAMTKDELDKQEPPGLRLRLAAIELQMARLRSRLDAPLQAYQAYLRAVDVWAAKRKEIEGSAQEPESLHGLKAVLAAWNELPAKIKVLKEKQVEIAMSVHTEKVAQAEVYRTLYGSVQQYIDAHVLAKDKLKLEFRAELSAEGFQDRLLSLLALNRRGSFMGGDAARERADEMVDATKWDDSTSLKTFLESVDHALHFDLRDGKSLEMQLKAQLAKGTTPEDVFDFIYGLEYIRPRYILRWEGKDLSMLSPGERGTLLLVFYLLIDKSDMPLVIDQPEGNLDNHTVAKVLVECIKEARRRRQVFIVTHNPNLAVVCDADQVIHASLDKANGNAISYTTGALENPAMALFVTDVLEGTRWAFDVRGEKYKVGE